MARAKFFGRYILYCGHVAEVAVTLEDTENPVICRECGKGTELMPEVLAMLSNGGSDVAGVRGPKLS